MEVGSWIIGASAIVISLATLWNGSRGATMTMLQNQIKSLQDKVAELERQQAQCESQLADMREQNMWLQKRWMRMRDGDK